MEMFADGTLTAFEALAVAISSGTAAINAATQAGVAAIGAAASNVAGSGGSSGYASSSTTLKSGSKGSDVTNTQNALIALGYNVGSTGADGIYGSKTTAAVKQFQKDAGLKSDGITGSQTAAALVDALKGKGYSAGGVASYTGAAMLHGSAGKSEVIFNAQSAKKLYDFIYSADNPLERVVANMAKSIDWSAHIGKYLSAVKVPTGIAQGTGTTIYIDGIQLTQAESELLSSTLTRIMPLAGMGT